MIVVDASVALKWFVDEDRTPAAVALLAGSHDLIAPELIIGEMCNTAWRMWRIGRMTKEQVAIVAAQAGHALRELVSLDILSVRASRIAMELDHPAYDCFYLALAEQRETRVVTANSRFIAKTRGSPWAEHVVALAT